MLYLEGEETPLEQDMEEELVTAVFRLEQTRLAQGVMCQASNEVEGTEYKVLFCVSIDQVKEKSNEPGNCR